MVSDRQRAMSYGNVGYGNRIANNNQPNDGAAWRLGAPWSMAAAKLKETKMHGFRFSSIES
jgi:hypothetical protein